jgi:tRNA-dihydrouridine synthase B
LPLKYQAFLGRLEMGSDAQDASKPSRHAARLVALAPMSGVTDLPFRRLAHRLGAPIVVSEMIASEELVRNRADVVRRAEGRDLSPFIIQLAGREAKWMAEGARIAESKGAEQIDINMGCPAKEVTGKLSGSALMRDLDHAQSLVAAVVKSVKVPVTLKMRLGWDQKSRNAPELAKRAEAEGVTRLTVHGRTRCQFFTARTALSQSGAAGVMVGRGAYGAPWLPSQISRSLESDRDAPPPAREAQRAIALEHIEAMLVHYGEALGLKNARKHIGWYLISSGADETTAKAWRKRLCTDNDPKSVLKGLDTFYRDPEALAA